jgi:WD40 repeat protein
MMAVSSIAMHPKKSICATASDDFTWKIWTLPQGELIMSGEGHKDWVSGIAFHPKGSHLATSSGDSTIKVWDFINASCAHTFKDHT